MGNSAADYYKDEAKKIVDEFTQLTTLPVERDPATGGYWLDCYSLSNSVRTSDLSAEFIANAADPIKELIERSDDLAKTVALEVTLLPAGEKGEMLNAHIEALTVLGSIVGFCQWAGNRLRKEGPQPE